MKPIRNRPVYRWLDPSHHNRKPIITFKEVVERGGRSPDPAAYRLDPVRCVWVLKDGPQGERL